jgi:hypothetical protein
MKEKLSETLQAQKWPRRQKSAKNHSKKIILKNDLLCKKALDPIAKLTFLFSVIKI